MTQRAKAAAGDGGFGERAAQAVIDAARGVAIVLGIAPAQGLQPVPVPVRVRGDRRSGNG